MWPRSQTHPALPFALALWVILLGVPAATAQSTSVRTLAERAQQAQSKGDVTQAIALYGELTRAAPTMPEAFGNLGALLYDAGQYPAAETALRRALALNPRLSETHTVLGACLLAEGHPAAARHELEEAARARPGDERNQNLLLEADQAMGDDAAAVHLLELRVQRHPADQEDVYDLGRAYLALSQRTLLRAHTLDPDSALSHLMQGEIEEGAGNMKQAEAEYQMAVTRSPQRADVHAHLGSVLWLQGLWARADAEFTQALQRTPGDCKVLWKKADALINLQTDPGTVLPLLQSAIERCPTLDQARVDRARVLIDMGKATEAVPDLLAAEHNTPDEPSIHFLLAKAYRSEGRSSDAAAETAIFGRLSSRPPSAGNPPLN